MKSFKFASTVMLLLLIALSTFSGLVSAQNYYGGRSLFGSQTLPILRQTSSPTSQALTSTTPSFQLDRVEIDGEDVTARTNQGFAIEVERGQTLPIDIFLLGHANSYDVTLRAYIGGYEYGTLEDETPIFEVENGLSYHKKLNLVIPQDIRASDEYNLYIEAFDETNSVRYSYKLKIQEKRHDVNTYDVILNPPSNVRAGQPLFASVRVENLGDNIEESIKVTISIPELGVSTSEYVDQLITENDLNQNRIVYARKDSASTNDLMLLIPENAKEGDYQVKTTVEYNRGHSKQESVQTIHIKGKASTPSIMDKDVVNFESTTQSTELGKGAVYKLSIANLGTQAKTYTIELNGVSSWGTSRVDPQSQTVLAEKTADFTLYINPNEGTQTGTKTFTAVIKDDEGNSVSEKALNLTINSATEDSKDTLKKVLEVAFVVLLIILVIVGLVVLVKRLGGDEPEETVEGKTYY